MNLQEFRATWARAVELRYESDPLRAGVAISIGAYAALAGLWGAAGCRRRAKAPDRAAGCGAGERRPRRPARAASEPAATSRLG